MFGRKPAANELKEIVDKNRFRIVRKIAEGGMGAVYEAVLVGAEGFEKTVAIKTIQESLSSDPEFVEMFIGEAKLVADLVHQYIVQIYQMGKVGSMYYMAMEYVEGVNLQEFMNRHYERRVKLPIDIGTYIISRVCRGLEYAHRKTDRAGNLLNVVHRDISPKNLMISTEGFVKLTDFGIAKARNLMKNQEGEVLMGKAQYMSPEQAQYMQTDGRSDLFSLGIVMWELLTGQTLFGSENTGVILENVVYKEIPAARKANPELPEEVERILTKALMRDPNQRYQDAGRMAYDLEYYMYHNRFGPTNVSLEKYMQKLFPEVVRSTPRRADSEVFPGDAAQQANPRK
jgi:serine/threonine-protein kinase